MKEKILKRAMFAMPLSKESKNSGIMSGFDMDEMEEGADQDENADMEEMPPMARTPQNPEIWMNTLRGDMRSVDARYMELAQMVGEEAARETPPEVLAMLQSQLGAQQGGIGALPGAPAMPAQPLPPEAQGIAAAMPPGMASAVPFSQGGAEEAPPTPDGMPLLRAFTGAFVTPLTRMGQWASDKVGPLAAEANIVGGRLMSQGFPQTFRPIFENLRGEGGRFTAEQVLKYPTLTEHLSNLVGPNVSAVAGRMVPGAPALAGGVGTLGLAGMFRAQEPSDPVRQDLLQKFETEYYRTRDKSIPMPTLSGMSNDQLAQAITTMTSMPGPSQQTAAPAKPTAPVPAAPAAA